MLCVECMREHNEDRAVLREGTSMQGEKPVVGKANLEFVTPASVKVESGLDETADNVAKKPRIQPHHDDSQAVAPILSKDQSIMLLLKCATLKDNMRLWCTGV